MRYLKALYRTRGRQELSAETVSIFAKSSWRNMKRVGWSVPWVLLGIQATAQARGVSPYLPLNLDPQIESQIERVLILADMPVMRRPIAAATVLDAIAKARNIDPVLCARVQKYLE